MPSFRNIAGQRLGRLSVIDFEKRNGKTYWKCRCDCGKTTSVISGALTRSNKPTRSCGCLAIEKAKETKSNLKHGHATGGKRSKLLRTWDGIMRRCYATQSKSYKHYGGRGILVDPRWHDFATFVADMGEPPSPRHSVDRIDNNRWYGPDNCRWATQVEQTRNSRQCRMVEIGGVSKPISVWAEEAGLPYSTVYGRIAKLGWPPDRACQINGSVEV